MPQAGENSDNAPHITTRTVTSAATNWQSVNRSTVVCGRSSRVSIRAGARLVVASGCVVSAWVVTGLRPVPAGRSPATTQPLSVRLAGSAGVASSVGANVVPNVVVVTVGGGMAAVPRIMRAYCEGEILGPMSHSRFVVNSPINSQTPIQASRHRETTLRKDGPQQRNLRLAQLILDLSGDEASCFVGSQDEHQAIAGLANACHAPGDWRTPQNRKVELRRKFAEPRQILVGDPLHEIFRQPTLARNHPEPWCDRPSSFSR